MCLCSVHFYTILIDYLLFDRCSLHGWSNMDYWIQRTVVYLSPVGTGTSRQCESLLDVTCVYRMGPLKYVFLFEVTCRSREECLWVECLWVFVRGNLYVQYRASRRCQSLWDIAPISIVEPLNRWESSLELICTYRVGPLEYMCVCWR